MKMYEAYDLIVIGSGIGGLTVAALMAKAKGKRVLVLERHYKPGGYTHDFTRPGGFTFNTGLHYLGTMTDMEQAVFNYITDNKVVLAPLPAPFETFIYPDFRIRVPDNPLLYQDELIKCFPRESKAIKKYFKDVRHSKQWAEYFVIRNALPSFLRFLFNLQKATQKRSALQTTGHYLEKRFKDSRLKATLASRWGDYGLPPANSAFAVHALIENHYAAGACYPREGTSSIYKAIKPVIEKAGGAVRNRHEAVQILIQDKKATGVKVRITDTKNIEEKVFYAPVIVSDAGVRITYEKLLPREPAAGKSYAGAPRPAQSCVILYAGLKESPHVLGVKGENIRIFESYDHNTLYNDDSVLKGKAQSCFLSFPSLLTAETDAHTAEIMCFVDYKYFEKWQTTTRGKRGDEYEELKRQIADGLVNLVEKKYPGFRKLIAFQELATPLSIVDFVNHPYGAMYGIPAGPERFRCSYISNLTPIRNLYLTGSDAGLPGVVGAMMSGLATASIITGPFGLFELMGNVMSHQDNP